MKLSCLPVSLFNEIINKRISLEDWVKGAADIGLDGLDMSVLFFPNRTRRLLEETTNILARHNMNVVMVTTYPDFTNPDKKQRERELLYLSSDIALASEIGAAYLRITAGQNHPGLNVDQTVKMVADYFERSAEIAKAFNVKLVYENHAKPGAWDMPDFLFDPAVFLSVVNAMKGTDVRVNFDTANTFGYGADTVSAFKEVFHSVETIHIADMVQAGKLDYSKIGQGGAPIREVLSFAKQQGFDGWLCIEECSNNGLAGIREAVTTVRQLWADV